MTIEEFTEKINSQFPKHNITFFVRVPKENIIYGFNCNGEDTNLKFSFETTKQLKAYHNIDAEYEILIALVQEIEMKIVAKERWEYLLNKQDIDYFQILGKEPSSDRVINFIKSLKTPTPVQIAQHRMKNDQN